MSEVVDYSLTGPSRRLAIDRGLADATWFLPSVDPRRLRELQRRTDARAAFDVALWLGLLVGSGIWAYTTVWSWWSIPAFAVYGALYGGASDSRWHEMGHGTAFRSRWANDLIYPVASFMLFRGPTLWRWSHHRHHTDTIIVGRDAEIAFQRPPSVARTLWRYTGVVPGLEMFCRLVRHAAGRLDADAADLVPAAEHRAVVRESRVFVAVVAGVVVWSVVAWTPLPILFIGGPTLYGMWLVVFFGLTQHAGLRENVLDHRYNTRTVLMNPVFRFLYLNMNYHVEHHMFPTVPYHALPALHREIADQLAPAVPSTWAAYRQIFDAFVRQRRDADHEIALAVPDVAGAPGQIDTGRIDTGRIDTGRIDTGRIDADQIGVVGIGEVDLAGVDELEVGELRRIDVADRTFVLARVTEREFALCDGLCTHAAVHLADGALVDGRIECPKHNARFDPHTGAALRKPAREPLGVYDVERVGERLVTRLRPSAPG